ncbi:MULTISPECIES: glycoside hydrolase family 25 protein [Lactobacillus]|uniref:Lysozyme n=1 Tax=Lactobacillus xujianguonis TaxID=2495899 RepID=A0A437ST12_9LACO|nr:MULTISPECIES: glycoside hydrolase family 25 protein [Lactobacillus]RVU69982.1 hypothetical protein EJK17_10045 [Lactobacillus xujianguonis]RVU72356.1 hypothetical protein EJK20_10350 [Lactobacillus xujianguonis]
MALNIVDLSSNNGPVNLAALKKAGADGVIIKATESTWYVNQCFAGQVKQAAKLGLLVGAYHYSDGGNATANIDFYWKTIKPYAKYIGLHVLDYEGVNITRGGVAHAKTALAHMKQLTGKTPVIYMGLSDENSYNWSSVTGYPLWVAQYNDMYTHYGFKPRSIYGSLRHWKSMKMFQYSSTTVIGGYKVDVSAYYGTKAEWSSSKGSVTMGEHWKAPVEFDDLGAFKVMQKTATFWSDANNDKKVGSTSAGKIYRITKAKDGFYKIANHDQWLDGRTGDFHANPVAYSDTIHAKIVVVKPTAGHKDLTTKVVGKTFKVGSTWKMFGYKTFKSTSGTTWHWARVGTGNNTYINLDKCRVLV